MRLEGVRRGDGRGERLCSAFRGRECEGERGEIEKRESVWVSAVLSFIVSHCSKPIMSLYSCIYAVQLIPLHSLCMKRIPVNLLSSYHNIHTETY